MGFYDDDIEEDERTGYASAETGNDNDEGGYDLSAGELPIEEDELRSFASACRRAGLSRNQAEDILGWHLDRYREGAGNDEAYAKQTVARWKEELRHDHDFGHGNYQRTLDNARRALEVYDTTGELRKLLKDTQFQFHPGVVRALSMIGKELGERGMNRASDRSLADRMYPGM